MIGSLRGELEARGEDYVIVRVGGIGFEIQVPTSVLNQLGAIGNPVELHTHMHVRENEISLYGCTSADDIALFRKLLTVSGIGPKLALEALSTMDANRLRSAIAQEQAVLLTQISGIGTRTAERLILDLKDKVQAEGIVPGVRAPAPDDTEVINALTSLGYSVSEAQEALRSLPDEELGTEEKIRLALKYFAGGE